MPNEKTSIKSYTRRELHEIVTALGEPKYRADQLHRWLFSDRTADFDSMTNLGSNLRDKLSKRYFIPSCSIAKELHEPASSRGSGTSKFLVKLHDGQTIETVLIPSADRNTVCVSSQVGCPLHCSFCATGYMDFTRSLLASEIVEQVSLVNDRISGQSGKDHVSNIVFMGMGEPLLNLPNVFEAIETLTHEGYRLAVSQRKITISTVGLVPQISEIARSGFTTKLAVSLHAADQEKRASLIPSAREHTLESLQQALEQYVAITNEPVTLVYMLIEGINDTESDAKNLARFGHGFLCKINLIDYNSIVNMKFKPVKAQRRDCFIRTLVDAGLHVTVRKSYGTSINAACGQLAITEKNKVVS